MTANTLVTLPRVTPSANVAVAHPTVWYTLHEGTGTTLADAMGYGPNISVSGTTTGIWTNPGHFTGDGATVYASSGSSTPIDNIFKLSDLDGKHIICGFEILRANSAASTEYAFMWGRDAVTAGYGAWAINFNGTDQPGFLFRGNGASSSTVPTFGLSIGDTHTASVQMMVEIFINNGYLEAILYQSTSETAGTVQINLSTYTLPSAAPDGLTLFGRRTSGATVQQWLGSGSSGSRMNCFFAQKRSAYDPTIGVLAWNAFKAARREFPSPLRG